MPSASGYSAIDLVRLTAELVAIVESCDDAIVSKDLNGIIRSWNAGAERLFGYTADEVIGRSVTILIPPERLDEEPEILARLRRGERVDHFESVRIAKDGRLLNVSLTISPVRDATGQIVGASKIARDISERVRSKEANRERERQFREMIDALPIAIYTTDAAGRITHFNPAAVEFSGRTPVLGSDEWCVTRKLYHLDGRPMPHEECPMAIALKEGRAIRGVEAIAELPDGTLRWFEPFPTPLFDSDGVLVGGINMLLDTTERRRTEAALRKADQRKDEFLAMLAHELRNPLAPIRNAVYILQRSGDGASVEKVREVLERQVDHMVRLVDDLMEVSRITRDKIELRKERIELAEIVTTAVETSKPLIDEAGHQLDIQLPDEPLILEADPVRLAQIFANLLNNAAKYTEQDGQIRLTARREGSDVSISVRDNGVGIAPDMLDDVFELFRQVGGSLARAQGGLGIGLTLAKRLVELHDGTIHVKSDGLGHGAEFVVRLPLAEGQQGVEEKAPPRRSPVLSGRRILVVDDYRDSANSLTMLLKLSGADVVAAYDGETALERIKSHRPSVVLLDIGMPKMDGYELARRAREETRDRDLTLIALTGWGEQESVERSRIAGIDHHLAKPVDYRALLALLASLPVTRP